jgi:hypothetical protein
MTDTSYFPTDDLDQAPEDLAENDDGGANKDLAFLGSVASIFVTLSKRNFVQIHFQAVLRLFACDMNISLYLIVAGLRRLAMSCMYNVCG